MTCKEFNKKMREIEKEFEIKHPELIGTNDPSFMDKVCNDYIIKHFDELWKKD